MTKRTSIIIYLIIGLSLFALYTYLIFYEENRWFAFSALPIVGYWAFAGWLIEKAYGNGS